MIPILNLARAMPMVRTILPPIEFCWWPNTCSTRARTLERDRARSSSQIRGDLARAIFRGAQQSFILTDGENATVLGPSHGLVVKAQPRQEFLLNCVRTATDSGARNSRDARIIAD